MTRRLSPRALTSALIAPATPRCTASDDAMRAAVHLFGCVLDGVPAAQRQEIALGGLFEAARLVLLTAPAPDRDALLETIALGLGMTADALAGEREEVVGHA